MEDDDRRQILDNIDRLIIVTKFENLINKCETKKILTKHMADDIKNLEESEIIKHRTLLEKITKRGPEAFDKLLLICNESGYQEAHRILKPTATYDEFHSVRDSTIENRPQMNENIDIKLEPYTEPINDKFKVNVVNSTMINYSSTIISYQMCSEKRGVFFLVNNTLIGQSERHTARMDRDYLISLFRGLGFTIFYYENILLKKLDKLIDDLVASDYLKKVDSFVFAILSDGFTYKKNTIIKFPDHTERVAYFLKKFNNQYCQNLINTPKIFIFPMCLERFDNEKPLEGTESDNSLAVYNRAVHDGVNLNLNPPTYSDMIYFFIDLDKKFSFTNYIAAMCNIWAEKAHNTHLEHLIKLVKRDTFLAGDITVDRDTHNFGFNSLLFFNPGITRPY